MASHQSISQLEQDFTNQSISQISHPKDESINQSISDSINESIHQFPEFKNQSINQSINLMELVQGISSAVGDKLDLPKLQSLMTSYDASLNEWRRFCHFDSTKKYTRNLIATDNAHFSLMLLCWNTNQQSPVHNHAGSECFMRVIDGEVTESQYQSIDQSTNQSIDQSVGGEVTSQEIDQSIDQSYDCDEQGQPLKLLRRGTYQPGAVLFINDSIGLHKITNQSINQSAVTLHCYLPPYEECNCYDEKTGKIKKAFTTFYSEHGEIVEFQ